jgi:hypothetical protein
VHRLALAVSIPLLVLTLSACTVSFGNSDKIDPKKAEKFLKDNIHPTVKSVNCPSGVKIKKGGTFQCTVTFANGKTGTVTLHMTNSSGHVVVSNSDIHVNS